MMRLFVTGDKELLRGAHAAESDGGPSSQTMRGV